MKRPRGVYIADDGQRELAFSRGKARLMRRAMELAVQCNAQVALVMFDSHGRLTQFSTSDMDRVLEHYGIAVLEPHERYTPADLLSSSLYANVPGSRPVSSAALTTRPGQGFGLPLGSPADSPSAASEAFQAAIGTQHLLGPLGLAVDASSFPPLSPRSEAAYRVIAGELERMQAALQTQALEQQAAHLEALAKRPRPAQQRQRQHQQQQQHQQQHGLQPQEQPQQQPQQQEMGQDAEPQPKLGAGAMSNSAADGVGVAALKEDVAQGTAREADAAGEDAARGAVEVPRAPQLPGDVGPTKSMELPTARSPRAAAAVVDAGSFGGCARETAAVDVQRPAAALGEATTGAEPYRGADRLEVPLVPEIVGPMEAACERAGGVDDGRRTPAGGTTAAAAAAVVESSAERPPAVQSGRSSAGKRSRKRSNDAFGGA